MGSRARMPYRKASSKRRWRLTDQDHLRRRVALLVPRLGSSFDGEALATVAAIDRALTADKKDWHWLADAIRGPAIADPQPIKQSSKCERPDAPPMTDWKAVVRFVELYGIGCLSERDSEFIDSLARLQPQRLSQRQAEWLGGIANRLGMRRSA